jgi:hypothetical protein
MYEPIPKIDNVNVHVISNREGSAFDTFAYNTVTHDSVYYAYDPQQPYGRRSLSSATDGRNDHTVSLFEDGTATIGCGLRVVGDDISGSALTIDPDGEVRVLVDGELAYQASLSSDPELEGFIHEGYINRNAANDLLSAFRWGDLNHLPCVRRAFPSKSVGTDGASYHVPPHIVHEMDTLILEAGAVPRPTLPLLIMPISINRN